MLEEKVIEMLMGSMEDHLLAAELIRGSGYPLRKIVMIFRSMDVKASIERGDIPNKPLNIWIHRVEFLRSMFSREVEEILESMKWSSAYFEWSKLVDYYEFYDG